MQYKVLLFLPPKQQRKNRNAVNQPSLLHARRHPKSASGARMASPGRVIGAHMHARAHVAHVHVEPRDRLAYLDWDRDQAEQRCGDMKAEADPKIGSGFGFTRSLSLSQLWRIGSLSLLAGLSLSPVRRWR